MRNCERSVGAHLSGEVVRRRALLDSMTPEITQEYHGSAGQSFGAFLADGITLKLRGEANDYVGKGLSGGTIAITAGPGSSPPRGVFSGDTPLLRSPTPPPSIAGPAAARPPVCTSRALSPLSGGAAYR